MVRVDKFDLSRSTAPERSQWRQATKRAVKGSPLDGALRLPQ
jgi:hypothetical protein